MLNHYTVVQDEENGKNILFGIACLFSSYWVFGIKYPKCMCATMTFCEYYLAGFKDHKPTAKVMRMFDMLTAATQQP